MPRVPTYQSRQNLSVAGSTGPSFREDSRTATAENFGGRQARQLSLFGQGLQNVGQFGVEAAKYNYNKSKLNASKAYTDSLNESNAIFNNARNTVGEKSVTLVEDTQKAFDKLYKAKSKDLSGLEREMFDSAFKADVASKMNSIYQYQNKAMKDYQGTLRNAQNSEAVGSAITGYNDAAVIQHSEETIIANTMAEYAPYGQEVSKKAAKDAVNNMHTQVIQSLSSDSPRKALAYLEANYEKMSPQTRDAVKTKVQDMALKENAEDTANFLVSQNLEPEEIEKEINKLSDDELKNETRKFATKIYQDKKNMEELQEKVVFETEFDKASQDPFNYKVPPSLSAKNEKALYAWVDALKQEELEKKGIGATKYTDMNQYLRLVSLPPSELAKEDLTKYISSIKPADLKQIAKAQTDAKEHTKIQTIGNYVNQLVKAKVDKDDVEGAASLRSQFEGMVNQLPKEKRGDITELNKIKDSLLMDVVYPGESWFSNDTYWKAVQRGETGIVPENKPDNVPREAKWVDYTAQGKNIRGWVQTRADGTQVVYMLEGKEAVPYQIIPKSKVAER